MKYNKADLKRKKIDLARKQAQHIMDFPKRENIPVYDWGLDLEENDDFILWELEMSE